MKRIIYSIFLVFFITLSVKAQNPREKLRTFKVAFITQELDLSPEEAQKFWPIYNAYNKKKAALRKKMGEEIHQKIKEKGKENLSEKEAGLLLDNYIAIKAKENKLDEEQIKQLLTVLSAKKVMLLQLAEKNFRHKLLSRHRKGDKARKGERKKH